MKTLDNYKQAFRIALIRNNIRRTIKIRNRAYLYLSDSEFREFIAYKTKLIIRLWRH